MYGIKREAKYLLFKIVINKNSLKYCNLISSSLMTFSCFPDLRGNPAAIL